MPQSPKKVHVYILIVFGTCKKICFQLFMNKILRKVTTTEREQLFDNFVIFLGSFGEMVKLKLFWMHDKTFLWRFFHYWKQIFAHFSCSYLRVKKKVFTSSPLWLNKFVIGLHLLSEYNFFFIYCYQGENVVCFVIYSDSQSFLLFIGYVLC